ncbi:hypothetical protein [Streptomyces galilaeus]|uniref:hypothetical protein n=1 Tax=Streptomyces galilaeus TaxID=33899 RepID=UPI0038F64EDA
MTREGIVDHDVSPGSGTARGDRQADAPHAPAYMREAAPDVLATARAQRWDPVEVLRLLITEEVTGRDAATRRLRRTTANFPTGKTLGSWQAEDSTIPEPTQNSLATLVHRGHRSQPAGFSPERRRAVPSGRVRPAGCRAPAGQGPGRRRNARSVLHASDYEEALTGAPLLDADPRPGPGGGTRTPGCARCAEPRRS